MSMEKQYEVRITEPAERQLREIVRYVSDILQERATAARMLELLEREILSLSQFPNRFALTPEEPWRGAGVRRMPVKNYLVYFWVDEANASVYITAVLYARRDQKKALTEMTE